MEVDLSDLSNIQGWLQLVTSGGFAALTWYLIVKALPNMQARFDAHSDRQMARFETQMDSQRTHSELVIKGLVERYERQLDRITGTVIQKQGN